MFQQEPEEEFLVRTGLKFFLPNLTLSDPYQPHSAGSFPGEAPGHKFFANRRLKGLATPFLSFRDFRDTLVPTHPLNSPISHRKAGPSCLIGERTSTEIGMILTGVAEVTKRLLPQYLCRTDLFPQLLITWEPEKTNAEFETARGVTP